MRTATADSEALSLFEPLGLHDLREQARGAVIRSLYAKIVRLER